MGSSAAAWCWRLGVEAILGIRKVGTEVRIDPHVPSRWPGFEATLRTEGGVLEIDVDNSEGSGGGALEIEVDGSRIEGNLVALPTDGATRRVRVRLLASEHRSPSAAEAARGRAATTPGEQG